MNHAADHAAARVAASRAALLQAWRADPSPPAGDAARQLPLAWRLAGAAASGTAAAVAQRHPWLLVGAAAAAGGLMVTPHPWRWALRPPLVLSVLARLAWRTWSSRGAGPRA